MDETAAVASLGYGWAALLGLLQGVTEFLPISSSGHLALAEHLGMGAPGDPFFDVMLHAGTLLAVIVYFWKDFLWYVKYGRSVFVWLVVALVPAVVIGLLCEKWFLALRFSPNMICLGLLVTAAALSVAEMRGILTTKAKDLGWMGSITVGLCQALALAPGISRSGLTLTGAMFVGVEKEDAFRFSFLLSVPTVGGAAFLHVLRMVRHGGFEHVSMDVGPLAVGVAVAAVSGYLALSILRRVVVGGKLVWFAGYCCLAALAGLAYFNFFA